MENFANPEITIFQFCESGKSGDPEEVSPMDMALETQKFTGTRFKFTFFYREIIEAKKAP